MLVLLAVKQSRLEQHISAVETGRERPLKEGDPVGAGWNAAHREHRHCVDVVMRELSCHPQITVRTSSVDKFADVVKESPAPDLFLVVGGDGTFLSASHYVGEPVPMLGVNSAPGSSTGFFCAADAHTFPTMLRNHLEGPALRSMTVNRMEVSVLAGMDVRVVSRRVLNDVLFCNSHPAATSRFVLEYHGMRDVQSSSGVWVGTAAGSTGAIRSAGGAVLPLDSRNLQLVVREPIDGHTRHVVVVPGSEILVRSRMDLASVYVDGPHTEARVSLGDTIAFRCGEPLRILGLDPMRKR